MGLCGSTIKKFLLFQETEFSYISGNRNLKKHPILQEITFHTRKKKQQIHPKKISLIFLKESFFYISRNGNPKKITYISRNGTSLYFGKLLIFQQATFYALKMKKTTLKKLLISQEATCKA